MNLLWISKTEMKIRRCHIVIASGSLIFFCLRFTAARSATSRVIGRHRKFDRNARRTDASSSSVVPVITSIYVFADCRGVAVPDLVISLGHAV